MKHLFKTVTFTTALAILAPSFMAHAQNVAPAKKERFSNFAHRKGGSDDDFMSALGGAFSFAEGVAGGIVTYNAIENFVSNDLNTLSRLRAMKHIGTTGVLAIDLSSEEFKYLWKQYLIDEKQAVDLAVANQESARMAMETAGKSLSNISNLPAEVNVGAHSASKNSQAMNKTNTQLFKDMRAEFKQASAELSEAQATLAKRRLQFFNPLEKEIFNSPAAKAVRAEMDRYAATLRRGVAGTVAQGLLGGYLLVDGFYKLAIIIDGRDSGLAPLIYNTAKPAAPSAPAQAVSEY